jgi:hypothetical protein
MFVCEENEFLVNQFIFLSVEQVLCMFRDIMKTIEIFTSVEEIKKIDAFHPPEENSNSTLYNEWHYFNVMDEDQHLSVICTFKLSGIFNASQILFGFYTNYGNSNTYFKVYPISIAEYSSQTLEV